MDDQNFQFIAEIETSDRQTLVKIGKSFFVLRFLKGENIPFQEIKVSKLSFSDAVMFYKVAYSNPIPSFSDVFGDLIGDIEVSPKGGSKNGA